MWRSSLCAAFALWGLTACRAGFEQHDGGTKDDGNVVPRKWSMLSLGETNGCAITEGALWCWGAGALGILGTGEAPSVGLPARVGDATDWTAVSVSRTHACGLRGDGDLFCWGSNTQGGLGTGPVDGIVLNPLRVPGAKWTAITTGERASCGIRTDGTLWCWGRNEEGQLGSATASGSPPTQVGTATWKAVSLGIMTTCGIQTDDTLWCWGFNGSGSVGDGTSNTFRDTPVAIEPQRRWKSVSTNEFHTCAIDTDSQGWCWGYGGDGRLGIGVQEPALRPRPISVPAVEAITTGARHSCAILPGGELACFGHNGRGELPGVASLIAAAPVGSDLQVTAVDLGGNTTCFLDPDRALHCTGANGRGQAGVAPGEVHALTRADDRTDWVRLYAHRWHACGETAGSTMWCWGSGSVGELGDGASTDRQTPVQVGTGFRDLSMNGGTTAAIKDTDQMWGWGIDIPRGIYYSSPHQFPGAYKAVVVGERHTCAIKAADDQVTCGGNNEYGQLGDGTAISKEIANVMGGTVRALFAGNAVTCATATTGGLTDRLYCWGARGGVGSNGTGDQLVPGVVTLPSNLETLQVTIGMEFVCGRFSPVAGAATGQIWCWGYNGLGQLGVATPQESLLPVRVGDRSDWIAIEAGDSHACAIAADKSLWCWGAADRGQLGEPLQARRLPTQVGTDTDWVNIALGDSFTCAVKQNGTRWCMGANVVGELGNGRSWLTEPVLVP